MFIALFCEYGSNVCAVTGDKYFLWCLLIILTICSRIKRHHRFSFMKRGYNFIMLSMIEAIFVLHSFVVLHQWFVSLSIGHCHSGHRVHREGAVTDGPLCQGPQWNRTNENLFLGHFSLHCCYFWMSPSCRCTLHLMKETLYCTGR